MSDANEMVTVVLSEKDRRRLFEDLAAQMERRGLFKELDLGFELPKGWPMDVETEVTLAQLMVLARKLKMRIVIGIIKMMPL